MFVVGCAHNEENNIKPVLDKLHRIAEMYGNVEIVIVNDGSTDRTEEIAAQHELPATILTNPKNLGKGFSLRNALWYIYYTYEPHENEIVVTMDMDGQHDPSDIPKLVKHLKEYDVVIGKRDFGAYPFLRRFTNRVYSGFLSLLLGIRMEDAESGFRAFRWKVVESILPYLNAERFEIEAEMSVYASRLGYRIGFVPVSSPFLNRRREIIIQGIKIVFTALKSRVRKVC